MKAFVKKLAKFKKPKHTLVSNTGSAPSSSADSIPSTSAGSAIVSAQVVQAADSDITVSVQLSLSHQLH